MSREEYLRITISYCIYLKQLYILEVEISYFNFYLELEAWFWYYYRKSWVGLLMVSKQSGSMIFGEQANVESVTFMPRSEGPDDLQRKLREAVDRIESEEILFLVGLWEAAPSTKPIFSLRHVPLASRS